MPNTANRTYLLPSSVSKESNLLASGHALNVAAEICAIASSRFFTGAVHAVAYCSGAPPVEDVDTQLYVAGHLRSLGRAPAGSRPVGSPASSPTTLARARRGEPRAAASAARETTRRPATASHPRIPSDDDDDGGFV